MFTAQLKRGILNIYDHVHARSGRDNYAPTATWLTPTPGSILLLGSLHCGKILCLRINKMCGFYLGSTLGMKLLRDPGCWTPSLPLVLSSCIGFSPSILFRVAQSQFPSFSWLWGSAVRTQGQDNGFPKGSHGSFVLQSCPCRGSLSSFTRW